MPDPLDSLAIPPRGVWLRITDSHDVNGGNDDGFNSTYSFLHRAEDGWVLFEHEGPGTLLLVRTIGFKTDLIVYADGEQQPLVRVGFDEMYSGEHPDFPAHLVADEDRGHGSAWSFAPVTFRKRVRVVAPEKLESYHFYNIWAHVYRDPVDEPVDNSHLAADLWNHPDTPPDGDHLNRISGERNIEPYESATVFDTGESGTIRWLTVRLSDPNPDTLRALKLRAYWNDDPEHSVYAPVGLFFGVGYPDEEKLARGETYRNVFEGQEMHIPLERTQPRAVPVGETDEGTYYCRLPMPFRTGARIDLVNTSRHPIPGVSWEIGIDPAEPDPHAMAFHADWRAEDGTVEHRDYALLDVRGHGQYVGCVMRMSSRVFNREWGVPVRWFLEGDARFYVDDALAFLCGSTGTEEYFNWGWYDVLPKDRTFSFPLHGYTEHSRDVHDHSTMYRFHLTDPVPYYRSLRFDIEHGPEGNTPSNYESVAFYYHDDTPHLILTDVFDVGDPVSEEQHASQASGVSWEGRRTLVYEGNDQIREKTAEQDSPESWYDVAGITDNGRTISNSAMFRVAILPENDGVKLRRRFDGEFPPDAPKDGPSRVVPEQLARVFVDGEEVGTWLMPAHHSRRTWMEDEYEIPPRFSAGKDRISVTLRCESPDGWNEFRYWAFSYTS